MIDLAVVLGSSFVSYVGGRKLLRAWVKSNADPSRVEDLKDDLSTRLHTTSLERKWTP